MLVIQDQLKVHDSAAQLSTVCSVHAKSLSVRLLDALFRRGLSHEVE